MIPCMKRAAAGSYGCKSLHRSVKQDSSERTEGWIPYIAVFA